MGQNKVGLPSAVLVLTKPPDTTAIQGPSQTIECYGLILPLCSVEKDDEDNMDDRDDRDDGEGGG